MLKWFSNSSPRRCSSRFFVRMSVLVAIFMFCVTRTMTAQNDSLRTTAQWFNLGIGAASRGFAGNMSLNASFKQLLITMHYCGDGEILGEQFEDYGLLVGAVHQSGSIRYSGAAGVAIVRGKESGIFGMRRDHASVIGLPFEIQCFYRPWSYLGIGMCLFAVASIYPAMYGATVSVQFGS